MKKQWKIKSLETKTLPGLSEYPSLILRLLAMRGKTSAEAINDFLNPDFTKLHDSFLFRDMQKAIERIRRSVDQKEQITIYADYDADAITAAAILFLALNKLSANVDVYIPDRFTEGYGLNLEAIKNICNKAKLIITVDCGMNAVEEAMFCKTAGADLIITDHHELTGELPQALAIINPKNPQDKYPFPYLTGVGVAFKLVQALGLNGWEKWLLDLVALGTVADCQSLTGENRILVNFGLKVLAKTRWPGLKALLETAGLSASGGKAPRYDAFTLGFILAPRINAAGRIKHADIAFKLLVSVDPIEAAQLAGELNDLNKFRQVLTEQVVSEARAQIELISDKKVLLVLGADWPKGVVGLVAGKLAEEYNRPVMILSALEGLAVGSGRSNANFDLVAALNFSKNLLHKYGGHTQAAGFTLVVENIPKFHQKLLEYAETLNLSIEEPVLLVDAEIESDDISWENLNYLEKMEPFGIGNPKPKFVGRGFEVADFRTIGVEGKHLKLRVRYNDHAVEAIAFGQGFLAQSLGVGKKIDAVFEFGANEWNGRKDMQLKILDVKFNEN